MTTQLDTNQQIENAPSNIVNNKQFFTFMLANEEYGFDILSVLEIRGLEHMTSLPSAPKYIKGVVNLRGNIIPAMDLRERFNIESIPYNRSTVMIVVQIVNNENKKVVGIIVDSVSDVYSINQQDIQPKPEFYHSAGNEYISGLVTIHLKDTEDKLVILLDVNQLFDVNKLEELTAKNKHNHEKN